MLDLALQHTLCFCCWVVGQSNVVASEVPVSSLLNASTYFKSPLSCSHFCEGQSFSEDFAPCPNPLLSYRKGVSFIVDLLV